MIFKIQALAVQLYRVLLITIVFGFLKPWDAAGNTTFSIDNVANLAKKLAAEPFKPPQPVPDVLKQLSYDDYRDIRFDSEQSLWKETGSNSSILAFTILTRWLSIPMTRRGSTRLLSPRNYLPTAEIKLPKRCLAI